MELAKSVAILAMYLTRLHIAPEVILGLRVKIAEEGVSCVKSWSHLIKTAIKQRGANIRKDEHTNLN
jgi:hypothetical protein